MRPPPALPADPAHLPSRAKKVVTIAYRGRRKGGAVRIRGSGRKCVRCVRKRCADRTQTPRATFSGVDGARGLQGACGVAGMWDPAEVGSAMVRTQRFQRAGDRAGALFANVRREQGFARTVVCK